MGIQYFVALSEEYLAIILRPPLTQKSTTNLMLQCCGKQHAYDY